MPGLYAASANTPFVPNTASTQPERVSCLRVVQLQDEPDVLAAVLMQIVLSGPYSPIWCAKCQSSRVMLDTVNRTLHTRYICFSNSLLVRRTYMTRPGLTVLRNTALKNVYLLYIFSSILASKWNIKWPEPSLLVTFINGILLLLICGFSCFFISPSACNLLYSVQTHCCARL